MLSTSLLAANFVRSVHDTTRKGGTPEYEAGACPQTRNQSKRCTGAVPKDTKRKKSDALPTSNELYTGALGCDLASVLQR